MAGKKSDAARIKRMEKQRAALALRAAGLAYRKIGEELGIPTSTAANYVTTAMNDAAASVVTDARHVIALELERLDGMLFALAPALRHGNLGAIDRALKIMDMRAKLLGLYSAQEVSASLEVVITHASD